MRASSPFTTRVQILLGMLLAFSAMHIMILRAHHLEKIPTQEHPSFPSLSNFTDHALPLSTSYASKQTTMPLRPKAPKKEFDCAINWLRMPKTASTTLTQTFIGPLFKAGKFTNTELGPNTCIERIGGCAEFWGEDWELDEKKAVRETSVEVVANLKKRSVTAPRYATTNSKATLNNQRCFPTRDGPAVNCYEYDPRTSTMNFGPHRRNPKLDKHKRQKIKDPSTPWKPIPALPTLQQAHYDFSPNTKTHVGLDVSLFGWIMPQNPMVYSTFREPMERLLSSFHYGIQFGGGRPGQVDKCDLPGAGKGVGRVERWEQRVVKAREIATLQNDTTVYQMLLREYLDTCQSAADNAYVHFLDPDTHDVNVALKNLEEHVIVGLQTDMEGTLERWVNITKKSCSSHPQFQRMEDAVLNKILADIKTNGGVERKRASAVILNVTEVKTEETKSSSGIKLSSPDVRAFDKDLQKLLNKLIAGDEVIFKRVVEIYEEQRDWGRD
jgi:hypothetical protein